MIYGVANTAQFEPLVRAVLLGIVCGIGWDILRFFRRLIPAGRVRLFAEDVLFFAVWSLLTFLLCYVYNFGIVRAYILLAQPFGFFLWYCLPGRLTYRFADWLILQWQRFVVRPLCLVFCFIFRLFVRTRKHFLRPHQNRVKKSKKCKKIFRNCKKKTCKHIKTNV
ncbi:MAG: spore cortex biosynthesis protein YabQ [Clostridia bacterium]|nr:spore cortex biosynthesis protein YabQ [Clostridia bacterium]